MLIVKHEDKPERNHAGGVFVPDEKEIEKALTSVLDRGKLYKLIIDLTTDMLKAKYASLMIMEGDTLTVQYSNHLSEEILRESSVKTGTGISGYVALTKKPLLVLDREDSPVPIQWNNEKYLSKSFISIPLIVNEKVLGVINVNEKITGEVFQEDDLRVLKVVAKYSAIGIRNVTLIEKTKKQTIIQQLNNNYHDKSVKFLPVTLKSLMIGPFNKSELFLESVSNGKRNYVLYWKGEDKLFDSEKREAFIRKNIGSLYVPKGGKEQYLRFMEAYLDRVMEDKITSQAEKIAVFRDVAVNIMSDLIAAPEEMSNIERARQLINNVLDLIYSAQGDYIGLRNARISGQYLNTHFFTVTITGLLFARYLGMKVEKLNEFGLGLFLQDIGMRTVGPSIVNKPDQLSNEEYKIIKKHVETGFQLLQETGKVSTESCLLVLLHHENYDGSGYPHGLKRNAISYYARISRIVDVYSALTSDRPYAKAIPSEDACEGMTKNMKELFDPELLECFTEFLKSAKG
ncbi:MAG: GAF domain-containing protein [Candidatus Brocadiaceae baterium WH-1]|nr:MAG: GAF domain-containing protein [Candidatus Jettenia sp. AMX2]